MLSSKWVHIHPLPSARFQLPPHPGLLTLFSSLDGIIILRLAEVSGAKAAVALAPVRLDGHALRGSQGAERLAVRESTMAIWHGSAIQIRFYSVPGGSVQAQLCEACAVSAKPACGFPEHALPCG